MEKERLNEKSTGKVEVEVDYSDENWLCYAAKVILVIGIIATVVMFFTITLRIGRWDTEFSWTGLGITILTLFVACVLRLFLRVVSNISTSLKDMNPKKHINAGEQRPKTNDIVDNIGKYITK
jgi:hypothetical protein